MPLKKETEPNLKYSFHHLIFLHVMKIAAAYV